MKRRVIGVPQPVTSEGQAKKIGEPACKPGSVQPAKQAWAVIHLGCLSPDTSSNLPESSAGHTYRIPIWSCSRRGLPCHGLLPAMRCALTAPFHPYRSALYNTDLGGLLSAALSVGFRPPGVTWRPTLWSPDFPPSTLSTSTGKQRLPGQLATRDCTYPGPDNQPSL